MHRTNLLILLRDVYNEDEAFLTWLLGSQTCEKTFRLARSMTTTFSTIINFSMLGLMRRLHRLQLQSQLHAESHTSGVVYPVDRTHQKKSGTRDFVPHSLKSISNSEILETVIKANARAKEKIKELGMEVLNVEKEEFCTKYSNDDGEQSDQEVEQNSTVINDVVREVCMDDPEHIKSDIQILSSIVSDGVKDRLSTLHSTLPETSTTQNQCSSNKHSPFLKLSDDTFIRKTTAVWLLQEGERVSSDRLFRVRGKQPFSTETKKPLLKKQKQVKIHHTLVIELT